MRKLAIASLLLLLGCGYRFEGSQRECGPVSVSIPYIKGDGEGQLNSELAKALSSSGLFDYVQNGGEVILEAAIISDGDERIGFRFDRNPTTGKLRDNIVGTENRRMMSVEIKLVDAYTKEILVGPQVVTTTADYDYVDSNSILDLVYVPPKSAPERVLDFSLGQLDSFEGSHDDSRTVIFRHTAQKIVDGLLLTNMVDRLSAEEAEPAKTSP